MEKLKVEYVPLEKLKPAPYNPRKWNDSEFKQLLASLEAFGFVEPIVVNKRTGHIVGGNQRFKAATTLGYKEVPVSYIDVSIKREKILNIALNKIDFGFDEKKLKEQETELQLNDEDLELVLNVLDLKVRDVGQDDGSSYDGEIQFSPIIHRKQDYVMILFDNNTDFTNFVENMNLKNVWATDKNRRVGVGRVVTYEKFLENVQKFV